MRVLPILCLFVLACTGETVPTEPGAAPMEASAAALPGRIPLPDGFWPEGIDFGRGSTFYVGSLATGAIYRGDARTGAGSLLVPDQPGIEIVGLKYEPRRDVIFAAGGFTGAAFVYDATAGTLIRAFQLAEPGTALINDVIVTRDAAYFTDSFNPVLYRIPLAADGTLPGDDAVTTLTLTGDYINVPDEFNANGIAATANGKNLIIVNTTTGLLYHVDPATGAAHTIDVGGTPLHGDGILLNGNRLHVVLGDVNQIAEVRLAADLDSGEVVRMLTSPELRFPSTIAAFGNALYAVNARFDVTPAPDVDYDVVAVRR